MKIDTVIDIARCKKTAVHTRLAHVLVGYKRMWGEETIEEMRAEKADMFSKLKGKKNDPEYDEWFLRYRPLDQSLTQQNNNYPGKNKTKTSKRKENKTRKRKGKRNKTRKRKGIFF